MNIIWKQAYKINYAVTYCLETENCKTSRKTKIII